MEFSLLGLHSVSKPKCYWRISLAHLEGRLIEVGSRTFSILNPQSSITQSDDGDDSPTLSWISLPLHISVEHISFCLCLNFQALSAERWRDFSVIKKRILSHHL